jgi:threonine/homoserine/homoserine lactone efflux protein
MRQTLILSVIYVAIATAIHATIVALAGSLQSVIVTAGNRLIIRRGFAIALVGIAIWFALTTGRSSVP